MPTMKNRQEMIDAMNKESRSKRESSFDKSKRDIADNAKKASDMYSNAAKLPTKEKYNDGTKVLGSGLASGAAQTIKDYKARQKKALEGL
jgi:hypothetical protein